MKFWTTILTAPRPVSTLARTRDSLSEAGFAVGSVFDGSPPAGEAPSPRWCTEAYINLFLVSLRTLPEQFGLLVFEDDVVVCRGLYEYLTKLSWPDDPAKIAMVTPYCPTAYSNYRHFKRWHREDQRTTLAGTQAFLYTRHVMESLVHSLEPEMRDEHGYIGVDVQIGRYAKLAGLHIYYHVPSLVQHIGIRNSAVGFADDLGTIYSAETFPGEDFDARSLLE